MNWICASSCGRNESVVVLRGLNAREGNEVMVKIVGKYVVPGRNVSDKRLLKKCAKQELLI